MFAYQGQALRWVISFLNEIRPFSEAPKYAPCLPQIGPEELRAFL